MPAKFLGCWESQVKGFDLVFLFPFLKFFLLLSFLLIFFPSLLYLFYFIFFSKLSFGNFPFQMLRTVLQFSQRILQQTYRPSQILKKERKRKEQSWKNKKIKK